MGEMVLGFRNGYRKDAVRKAIELVKETGRAAAVVVCRDISGNHTGGEGCFCDPKIIEVYPEDLE